MTLIGAFWLTQEESMHQTARTVDSSEAMDTVITS